MVLTTNGRLRGLERARLAGLLILLPALLLTSGCGDDDPQPAPGGPVDYLGRPIIPCTGDLCFDFDSPEVQAGIDAANAWAREAGLDEWYAEEDIIRLRDMFAACNYQRQETGMVQVDCPDWVTAAGCPPSFYFDVPGSPRADILSSRVTSGRHYCVPLADDVAVESCEQQLACRDGLVCSGRLTTSVFAAYAGEVVSGSATLARCMDPAWCTTIEELEWPSGEQSCFYGDFTRPVTGSPEPQDCGSLPDGACAVNCACPDITVDPLLGPEPGTCLFVSEQRPVGVCGSWACTTNRDCDFGGRVCARFDAWPQWAEDYVAHRAGASIPMSRIVDRGVCTSPAVCDAWAARYSGLTCGDDEELEP